MPEFICRRGFFHRVAGGIHGAALAYLLGQDLQCASAAEERRIYDLKPRADDPTAVGTSQVADAVIARMAEIA